MRAFARLTHCTSPNRLCEEVERRSDIDEAIQSHIKDEISSQVGLILSINAIFCFLEPPLSCFSRIIATSIVSAYSAYTSVCRWYLLVKPLPTPRLCSSMRFGKLLVTPTYKVPFLILVMM